ncbi:LysR family transcriptional regulator [Streptococcus parauberis]|uniref:LysR family transcriptional regulator n=1 Tax=Streptococcus parauberis TaxID=1348 RepID=UPI0002B9E530|nr:LysR family transcriptional regulator [Streptococcus parauberis]EMF50344.1 LysR-family transcriptional regulator [Streptococcus parauberis KRS-02109]UWM86500.1 LysR family transcriptional regulator [Streptococcus parauberis]UWM88471.1 LysR family transcriptional regulator [Streptococcus parauberis]WEM59280.1 LysR family transcriptional regulator [Streptococcus parauberis]
MNLQHLRYFITLANLEHYTKAARQLHITQPTLSHAISIIESELGVILFEKKGRNISLTENGKAFAKNIQEALNLIDDSVATLQAQTIKSFNINIALLRVLSHRVIPNLTRQFLTDNPNSPANFIFYNDSGMTEDLLRGLIDGRYDLAFCSKIGLNPQITYIPIAVQDMVIVVPKNHQLAQKEHVSIADTLAYPQIWFSKKSGVRPVVEKLYQDQMDQVKIQFEIEEDETIAGLVAQNFGIAILPKLDFLKTLDVEIIELDELKKTRYYYMAYLNNISQPPAIKAFINYVTNQYQIEQMSK